MKTSRRLIAVLALTGASVAHAEPPYASIITATPLPNFGPLQISGGLGVSSDLLGFGAEAYYRLSPEGTLLGDFGVVRVDTGSDNETQTTGSVGYRHLFGGISSGGLGLGAVATLGFSRYQGVTSAPNFMVGGLASLQLDKAARAHFNFGFNSPDEGDTYIDWALGADYQLDPRNMIFGEVFGNDEANDTVTNFALGLRHWLTPGKLTLDGRFTRLDGGASKDQNVITIQATYWP